MLRFDNFGALIPRTDPRRLPDNAAQVALDCELTGGVITPVNKTGPFVELHDGSNKLLKGIPEANLGYIGKPTAPSLDSWEYIFKPADLVLNIWSYVYYRVSDGSDEDWAVAAASDIVGIGLRYTETGMILFGTYPRFYIPMTAGLTYKIIGPLYQVTIPSDSPNFLYGGPNGTFTYPIAASPSDKELPSERIPLTDANGNIYAYFEMADVLGPTFDETYQPESNLNFWSHDSAGPSTYCVAHLINMHYVKLPRKHFYYVQTGVMEVDSVRREGPPSDVSDEIILLPGVRPTIATPLVGGGADKNNLYRSVTGRDDFLLVSSPDAATYVDEMRELQNVPIPVYGNYTDKATPSPTADEWREGSIVHPGRFALAYYGAYLYASDIDRMHAYDLLATYEFSATIDGMVLAGSTALVFSDDKVFAVNGFNPQQLTVYEITDSAPLLHAKSLCRIGGTVFWATNDGLAACSGSSVEIITREHFTAEQWGAYTPANMEASVADNSIFLDGTTKLRFDLNETLSALTTYTTLTASTATWKSKLFWHEVERVYDWAQVEADDYSNLTLKVYADGSLVATITVNDAEPFSLGALNHAHTWEFEIITAGSVRSMTFFDRVVTSITNSVRLTPENTPCFRSAWVKFPDKDKFVAGTLSAQTTSSVDIRLSRDEDGVVSTKTVSGGNFFTLPRTVNRGAKWEIDVVTSALIDELALFTRTPKPVQDIHEVHNGIIPPWLITRFELDDKSQLKELVVNADSSAYPLTMNVYLDGSQSVTTQITVEDSGPIRLSFTRCSSIDIDFDGQDDLVWEVIMKGKRVGSVGDGVMLSGDWRGNLFAFPDRGSFACGFVKAASYPTGEDAITLTLYIDGSAQAVIPITDGHVFQLPMNYSEGSLWEVDIDPKGIELYQAGLIPWQRVPVEGNRLHVTANDTTGIPRWHYTRFQFPTPITLRSLCVKAEESVTLDVYLDGATSSPKQVVAADAYEKTISVTQAHTLVFNFSGDDYKVNDVVLFGEESISVPNHGLIMRNADASLPWRNKKLVFPIDGSFGAVQVIADDYTNLHLSLGAIEEDIGNSDEIKVSASLAVAREWDLDITHQGRIREVRLFGRVLYSVRNGHIAVRREHDPHTWLDMRFLSDRPVAFMYARVLSDSAVTFELYDSAGTLRHTESVSAGAGIFPLTKRAPGREWRVDIIAASSEIVHEVQLATSLGRIS